MKKTIINSLSVSVFIYAVISLPSCVKEVSPPEAVFPVPSERQLAWHELEQYAFICYTVNNFTDKEWGYGDESPSVFNPSELDAEQWASTVKAAGLKGIILTCKHHDGFCLWPSQYTEHSVKNSPYRDGKGDVVKEVSDACRKYGLKFGVYLSPWDRNHARYGEPEYITCFRNQLTELLSNYGEVVEVWFDGANGGDGYYGGAREVRKIDNRTYYDWPNTHALVRKLAPKAVMFSDAGPDIRWCGNERGYAGATNWCMIDIDTIYPGKPGINDILNSGSETGTSWIPAEVDVSIRPGWFYHASEDGKVRTPENLLKLYLESVGRGANLLLNLPPDTRGLIHENDVKALLK
jgi:alpha-L-fucosidase